MHAGCWSHDNVNGNVFSVVGVVFYHGLRSHGKFAFHFRFVVNQELHGLRPFVAFRY